MPEPDHPSTVMIDGRILDPDGRRWIAATACPTDHVLQRGPVLISAGISRGGYEFLEKPGPELPALGGQPSTDWRRQPSHWTNHGGNRGRLRASPAALTPPRWKRSRSHRLGRRQDRAQRLWTRALPASNWPRVVRSKNDSINAIPSSSRLCNAYRLS